MSFQQPDVQAVVSEAEALLGGPEIFRSEEIFFPSRKRTLRRRLKSIKALLPTLKRTLEPGEKVHFISAWGFILYLWEQLFGGGAWAAYANATTFVLTDRRLLAFNVKSHSRIPKDIKNALPLSEITSLRRFLGRLSFRLRDGRKLQASLPPGDAKKLRALLQHVLEDPARQIPAGRIRTRSLQYLCPVCCKPVNEVESLQCPSCRAKFRSGRTAALRSLLLPGLGDIYLKHTVPGALELVGSVIIWIVVISSLVSGEGDAIAGSLVLLAIVNGSDFFVTRAMARKGIVAKSPQ